MKPNVDLTFNRDFSQPETTAVRSVNRVRQFSNRSLSIGSLMKVTYRFPWSFKESIPYPDEGELILTGDKQERKEKREWESYTKGEYCERCGKDLSNMPWDKHYTLCSACDEALERTIAIQRDLVLRELVRG